MLGELRNPCGVWIIPVGLIVNGSVDTRLNNRTRKGPKSGALLGASAEIPAPQKSANSRFGTCAFSLIARTPGAQRRASGAANGRSEVRAKAIGGRLQAMVRRVTPPRSRVAKGNYQASGWFARPMPIV